VNPADEAQVEQAKFNAREAKRQAGLLMGDVTTNALRFNEQAEQKLSQGVAVLGKTGNLGFDKSESPDTGIDVGTTQAIPVVDLKNAIADLEKQIAEAPEYVDYTDSEGNTTQRANDITELERKLSTAQEQLGALTGPDKVPSIAGPDSLLYASGSDLLTMTSLRDKMERDKRALIRKGQSEAYSMLLAGENFENQAGYAREAGQYNMWANILGGGIKLAGTAATFGLFG